MKSRLLLLVIVLIAFRPVPADEASVDILGNAVSPDLVTVYVYRPKKWGGMLTPISVGMTDLDGQVVLKNKTYYKQTTDLDGPFEFDADIKGVPEDFEIYTELGKVYYVRCFFDDKTVVAKPGFEVVDESTAKKEFKKLKVAKVAASP